MPRLKPSLTALAKAYSVSRQALSYCIHSKSIPHKSLLDPDKVFAHLLTDSRSSPFRARLANPKVRATITTNISKLL